MSPLNVRRYRAERLLRREYQALRGRVLAGVRARLRAAGVALDQADLDACYSQAWHGLYTAMLDPHAAPIANPEGWLGLVTFRRALDEHRARRGAGAPQTLSAGLAGPGPAPPPEPGAPERDLADELDDRTRLRQLMEGLRARLSPRERQAATLCYLHGLTRAEAATRMGISEKRMRKLMDGAGAGAPGVAAKVGALLESIRAGSYCAEQDSLMRGFALGILDPLGERHALALAHQRHCPACRARVLALRGLAAVLPPLPLPAAFALGASAAGAGAGLAKGGAGVAGAGGTGASATAVSGAGASAGVSSGAGIGAGAGIGIGAGAGGGWVLAGGGGLAGHLAVGCLLAAGVGAGCLALAIAPLESRHAAHHDRSAHVLARSRIAGSARTGSLDSVSLGAQLPIPDGSPRAGASGSGARSAPPAGPSGSGALTQAARASREFGLERAPQAAALAPRRSGAGPSVTASAAAYGSGWSSSSSAGSGSSSGSGSGAGSGTGARTGAPTASLQAPVGAPSRTGSSSGRGSTGRESGSASSAAREFGPG